MFLPFFEHFETTEQILIKLLVITNIMDLHILFYKRSFSGTEVEIYNLGIAQTRDNGNIFEIMICSS